MAQWRVRSVRRIGHGINGERATRNERRSSLSIQHPTLLTAGSIVFWMTQSQHRATGCLCREDLTQAALRLAKETRSLCGIPITPWPLQKPNDVAADAMSRRTPIPQASSSRWPPVLKAPPTALEFARVVSAHTPALIEGCFDLNASNDKTFATHANGLAAWKGNRYLVERMGKRKVKVAMTPDGRADDIKLIECPDGLKRIFTLPYEAMLTFEELFEALRHHENSSSPIAYLSSQNSNLTDPEAGDLSPLLADLRWQDAHGLQRYDLAWASDALGSQPEALNIWIGDESSQSSMHRDHYENVFTVVRGTKIFHVYPPTEAYFLCDGDFYPTWQYAEDMSLQPCPACPPTPWIPIDPTELPTSSRNAPFPRFAHGLAPIRIVVNKGQTLYLPAGWFHHVSQIADSNHLAVCVNWWYDAPAAFGDRWATSQFIREVSRRLEGSWTSEDEAEEV